MPTITDLADEYHRRETAAGGLAVCDPLAIVADVAEHFGQPFEDVRELLLLYWEMRAG